MPFNHVPIDIGYGELECLERRGQRWYKSPSGEWYPSITTVLSHSGDKSGLDRWREAVGTHEANKRSKLATDRGTAVHDMVEKALKNVDDPTLGHLREHVESYNKIKLYLKKINNIRCQECVLYSDVLKVAGRVDLIAEFQGVLSVIDFKTSTKSKLADQLLDYYIQETFYALAFLEMSGVEVNDIVTMMTIESEAIPTIKRKTINRYIPMLLDRIQSFKAKYPTPTVA